MTSSPHMDLTATEKLAVPNPVIRSKKKVQPKLTAYRFMIFYRFILAALGGYALATFAAIVIAQYFTNAFHTGFCHNFKMFSWQV